MGIHGRINGNIEIPGDNNGAILGSAIGSTAIMTLYSDEGYWNSASLRFEAASGVDFSKDGETFSDTLVVDAHEVTPSGIDITFRRTSRSFTGWFQGTTTPHLADVPVELMPAPPAEFTPEVSNTTSSSCRVSFSTTDPNGDSITYRVAVSQSNTPPGDWSGYSNVTSPYDVTGLLGNVTYYAHVRAFDGALATVGTSAAFSTAVDETSPATPTGLTATDAGNGVITLANATSSDDIGIAKWQRRTGSGSWVDIPASASNSMPSVNVSGNTIGSSVSFTVRTLDAAGNASASSDAVTITPIFWYDDFADNSLNTSIWYLSESNAGGVTETGGRMVMNTGANVTWRSVLGSNYDIKRSLDGRVRSNFVQLADSQGRFVHTLYQVRQTNYSTFDTALRLTGVQLIGASHATVASKVRITYINSGGTQYYWDDVAGEWTTTAKELKSASNEQFYDTGDTGYADVEVDATNSRLRFVVHHNENNYTTTTGWVAFSELPDNAADRFVFNFYDPSTVTAYNAALEAVSYGVL